MKIFKLLIIAIAVTTLSSCSSDDDSPRVELTLENVAGTYQITLLNTSFELSRTASNGEEVVIETETCEGDTFNSTRLILNADGTFTTTGSYREICELRIDGNTTTEDPEIVPFENSGSYSVNDTNNTFTLGGLVSDVVRFDDNRLYLLRSET